MKLYLITVLAVFCLTGCTSPPHIIEADRIMDAFTEKMGKEGYQLFMSGGAMMDDIQKINLGYKIDKPLTIEDARFIIVNKTELLLNMVNNDSRIRPYLHTYPFTSKNIHFGIISVKEDGEFVDPPLIASAQTITNKDIISYCVNDADAGRLNNVHKESYQEALQIYKETYCNHEQLCQ